MGKTPKKAAPGGDERNLYVRRLKATTTSSSKDCDTSLTARQRESDNSNRVKPIGVQKRLPVPVAKVFKSKLRSPSRTKCHHALKNTTRFQPSTSKDDKKLTSTTIAKSQDIAVTTMYTESEESAVELKVSITKKDMKETIEKKLIITEETIKDEDGDTCVSHSNTNGKEIVELTETERTTPREEYPKETSVETIVEITTIEESSSDKRENGDESSETIKNDEDEKIETERASSESEESSLKLVDEPEQQKLTEHNGESVECTINGQKEENIEEMKDSGCANDVTKITENCSVDVVESTTSETSDSGNVTQSDKETEITEQSKDSVNANDPSFVSYDSSIMLKDVQIKLNDCLKENSKLFETSSVDEANIAEQHKRLDMSFGKTLRNISGRSTINRLRYVTVRETRFSPNDSLFVNTSSVSLDHEDPTMSCKSVRYPTDISESLIQNSSPAERKRKIAENAASVSSKKLKTDTSTLLNTSLEMIKGIRRPVQVSTPNAKGYKFQSDKLSYKSFSDEKLTIDNEVESKKWCVVM